MGLVVFSVESRTSLEGTQRDMMPLKELLLECVLEGIHNPWLTLGIVVKTGLKKLGQDWIISWHQNMLLPKKK